MLEQLHKILRTHMNDYADDLAGGACPDFPAYKHLTGVIAGLVIAERELLDLLKKQNEGDFEE